MEITKGKTILIDETKCNGCGLCVSACHEGVIALVDGKAKVVKEDFCDGLGSCIPQCPQKAISPVERKNNFCPHAFSKGTNHWPIQLALLSPLSLLSSRELVIAADCTAFVLSRFQDFLKGRRVIIFCPKLDDTRDYQKKLNALLSHNPIHSLEVIHMEVPCCFQTLHFVENALRESEKKIPFAVTTVGINGQVIDKKPPKELSTYGEN